MSDQSETNCPSRTLSTLGSKWQEGMLVLIGLAGGWSLLRGWMGGCGTSSDRAADIAPCLACLACSTGQLAGHWRLHYKHFNGQPMAHVIWRQYRVCPVASGNHTARLPRSFTFSTNSASLRCTARAQHESVLCPWRHSCLPPCMHPAGSIHSPRTALPSDSYKAACSQPSQASDSLVHFIAHLTAIIAAFDSSGRSHSTKSPFHQAFRPSHRPLSSFFLHPNHRHPPYITTCSKPHIA